MSLKPDKITTIVVHCSATKADYDIGAKEIDEWHRDPKKHPPNGWAMIGYHAVIRRDGKIEGGRPTNMMGAHVAGHNSYTLGLCMVGGLDARGKPEDNFTDEQYLSLAMQIENWCMAFHSINDVCGHRDLSPDQNNDGVIEKWEWLKDCPCFDVREWRKRTLPNLFKQEVHHGPDNITRRSISDWLRDFFSRYSRSRCDADAERPVVGRRYSDAYPVFQSGDDPLRQGTLP